jgi:AraC-like DNA-binding protein
VFRLSEYQQSLVSSLITFMETKSTEESIGQPEHHFLSAFDRIPYYSQMIITYLNHLLLSLADESTIASVSSAPDAVTFSKAISYLNSNLHRQPSVSEIARFSNVSETGLKRIFEKFAGISVHRYLLKLKIKAAMELLQDGENVSNVSERIGFGSQSYFSKAFKRETGVSPSEFKTSENTDRSK